MFTVCQPYAMSLTFNLASIVLAVWFIAEPKDEMWCAKVCLTFPLHMNLMGS